MRNASAKMGRKDEQSRLRMLVLAGKTKAERPFSHKSSENKTGLLYSRPALEVTGRIRELVSCRAKPEAPETESPGGNQAVPWSFGYAGVVSAQQSPLERQCGRAGPGGKSEAGPNPAELGSPNEDQKPGEGPVNFSPMCCSMNHQGV